MLSEKLPANLPQKYPLALITGAAHRLGKIFALSLARSGYAVVLHYHRSKDEATAAEEEIKEMGVPVFTIRADLRKNFEIRRMFERIQRTVEQNKFMFSSLRVLVNSAGVMAHGDVKDISPAEFDDTIALNLRAPFFCAQMAQRMMVDGGLIVNISDIAAEKTWTGYPVYSMSKAGLNSMTKLMARRFAPGVRVNSIAPGLALAPDEFSSEEWSRLIRRVPSQRSSSAEELTSALEFLLKNEYITGQTIVVDGGYSLV